MVNWTPYLESLCNAYTQWWTFGTLKDVVEPKRFEFGLMVQTIVKTDERDAQQRSNEERKVERLSVLDGLKKYAPEHVLLVGRPGAGKSTALVRFLVAEAQEARQNPDSQIPVLVELRTYNIYYKTSVLDLVQASLKRRKLRLSLETLEDELAQGRFLLLMDGINELPDDEARNHIKAFRLDYSDVPMVFTTRDLGVGGDLGIEKKLELQSLTETEVEKFVREGMPGGSEERLQQLRQRLRELGQTPFVMWMLYFIVEKTGTVPSGVGSAFREFTQLYERRSKDDAPVSEESRRWWSRLLEHLAFEMMQAEKPTDFRLTISRREAVDILTNFLDGEKFDKPRDYALRWLEDLLKHHLIEVTSNDQIEFCHQLIQEYYAAERLLEVLAPLAPPNWGESDAQSPPELGDLGGEKDLGVHRRLTQGGHKGVSDDELKRKYLNYLKWTEPLALMLELLEDEAQAVRVVKLALEVDWQLGARLAGAVKPEWQEQTVGFVTELDVPQLLKIKLLSLTQSEQAIPEIVKALNDEDFYVRRSSVYALENIGSDAAIEELVNALNDEDSDVRVSSVYALENIGSDAAIEGLVNALNHGDSDIRRMAAYALGDIGSDAAIEGLVNALNDEDSYVRWMAEYALGNVGSDAAIEGLVNALNDEDSYVRGMAAKALGDIGSDAAIEGLVNALNHGNSYVRMRAAEALGKIDSDAAIEELVKALNDEDSYVRRMAVEALGNIGSDAAIEGLVNDLNHEDPHTNIRVFMVEALGKIGSDAAIEELVEALNDKDSYVRGMAAEALGKISSDAAIEGLVEALNDKDSYVRGMAAEALGKIGSDAAIEGLVKDLNDEDSYVCRMAVEALGKIGSDAAIEELVNALNDKDSYVRGMAAEALGKIGSDAAIEGLVNALNDEDSDVRVSSVYALGNIGSDATIEELVKVLNDKDSYVRMRAVEVLSKIGSDAAIEELVNALNDKDSYVRMRAVEALGKIDSDAAIEGLVNALNHEDPYVRMRVVEALGKIASPDLLPDLSLRLKTDKDTYLLNTTYLHNTIAAIQGRCQFYNYTLTQPPQMEDKPKSDVKRDQVFISYSHKDKKCLEKLQTMLKPIIRNKTILVWDDTKIQAGAKWRDEIEKALARANVAVLMVSANFLASDFIAKQELPPLLNAAEQEGLKVIWVPVGYCLYGETEIEQYQAVHNPSQPLESLKGAKLNEVLAKICREIKAASTATDE